MWRVDDQENAREARLQAITTRNKRFDSTRVPVDYSERLQHAIAHCPSPGDHRQLLHPPRELYMKDSAGRVPLEEIDLHSLPISIDWIASIVHALSAVSRKKGNATQNPKILDVSSTSITDAMLSPIQRLRFLREINISRCTALTDESLTLIRRQYSSSLEVLDISECRHFTSDVLCQVWRDCVKIHTLRAFGSMAVTDAFLQCLATTKRSAAGQNLLRELDIRHCKHVMSSGISHIATSPVKAMELASLQIGDCLEVDNMAFFGFEDSTGLADLAVLDLSGLRVDETAISWIVKGCTKLEQLNLSRCRMINDISLLLLSPLMSTTLQVLKLRDCPLVSNAGFKNLLSLEEDKRPKRMESEVTQDLAYEDDDDDEIASLRLQILNLEGCNLIGDATMHLLGRYCGRLTKLNLRGLRKVSDAGILSIAKGCPQLYSIKISGRHVTEQSFRILGKISPRLIRLDLPERQDLQTPECFLGLTSGVRPERLTKLNFGATNICDVGVSIIATSCPRLQWINIAKCQRVTDVGVEALAYCCHDLQSLLIGNTRAITDRSLIACALMRLPLRVVDLCGNTNITDTGVATLTSSCQQIQQLRLKGCDRLSFQTIKQASVMLPFTRVPAPPSLSQKLATGGGNASAMLLPLSSRHIELLELLISQYQAACVLQAMYRRWQQKQKSTLVLARRKFLRQTRAARKIQKCTRAFLSWRGYLRHLQLGKNMKFVVYVQAHIRGQQSRYRTSVWKFTATRAARCIQRGFRPHHVVRMKIRSANALVIQRVYRGFLGRIALKHAKMEHQIACKQKIWVWYRRCVNQREANARSKWLVRKIHNIQGQWRKCKRRQNLTKYLGFYRHHAMGIQTIWRGWSTRKRVRVMRIEWTAAAISIQGVFRAHRARCIVHAYRRLANQMATVIQKHWRRFGGQKHYQRDHWLVVHMQRTARYVMRVRKWRNVVKAAVFKNRNSAAKNIQRVLRGHFGRRRAVLFRKIRNAMYAKKGQNASQAWIRHGLVRNGAAIRIQRFVRRYQARRRMVKLGKWRQFVAARCLQRYWKDWMRRLRLQQKRDMQTHAVITLQRVYRGYQGRVAFTAEKYRQDCLRSSKLIQRVYRGYRGRCAFQQHKREMTSAAKMLQRAYRGRNARMLYEISQAAAALKAKEKYDKSLLGMLDAKRNPMDELYRRAKLPHEKDVLQKLHDKWEANRVTEERAVRKLTKEQNAQIWPSAQETVANHLAVRAKLYGVTENVYVSHREYIERQHHQERLKRELVELHAHVWQCQQALREAVASRRMLDGKEILEIMKAHSLLQEDVQGSSNQRDH